MLAYLGAFWNYLPVDGLTYNVAPGGNAKLGLLQSETTSSTMNFGARARQEVQLTNTVAVVGRCDGRANVRSMVRSAASKYTTKADDIE